MLPCTQTLNQEIGCLRDTLLASTPPMRGPARCQAGCTPDCHARTSLLSVSGIASSSLIEVRRVKLLLTVADRWGSLTSPGLVGVDMADGRIAGCAGYRKGRVQIGFGGVAAGVDGGRWESSVSSSRPVPAGRNGNPGRSGIESRLVCSGTLWLCLKHSLPGKR